jgi:signal transduction histidine kinase
MTENEINLDDLIKDKPKHSKEVDALVKSQKDGTSIDEESLKNISPESNEKKDLIMVIDDDPSQLISIEKILKQKYDLILCNRGLKAIKEYENIETQENVMSILLDIRLPDMNGFEVFEKLKDLNENIPIIFITGYQKQFGDGFEIYQKYRPHGYIIKNHEDENMMILNTLGGAVHSYKKILENEKAQNIKIRSQTVAGLLHDLKNIFMPIQNFPNIILTCLKNNNLEVATNFTKDMDKIMEVYTAVSQIMFNYAKGENIKLVMEDLNMTEILTEYIRLMNFQFGEIIKIEPDFNFEGTFYTDKTILRYQILLNIIKNASEAVKNKDSKVVIATYNNEQYRNKFGTKAKLETTNNDDLIIVVSDNGPGLPEEHIDKIFEPYFTHGKISGSGLGTYMIKNGIEELFNGELKLDNKPGEGLAYHICFPDQSQ